MLIILGRLKEEKMTSPLLVDLADVNKAMALCKDMPDIQSALKLMLPQPVISAASSGSGSGSGEGGYSAGSGKLYLILIPKDQFYTYFFVLGCAYIFGLLKTKIKAKLLLLEATFFALIFTYL